MFGKYGDLPKPLINQGRPAFKLYIKRVLEPNKGAILVRNFDARIAKVIMKKSFLRQLVLVTAQPARQFYKAALEECRF